MAMTKFTKAESFEAVKAEDVETSKTEKPKLSNVKKS